MDSQKKHLVKRLKVYQGDQHPHVAQDPKQLNIL
jgi:ribosomal protein L13